MQNDLFYNKYNYRDIKAGDIVAFDIGLQFEFTKSEEILLVKVLEITNAHKRTYPTAYIKRLEDWKVEEETKKENPKFKGKKARQVSVAWLFSKKNVELIRQKITCEIENIDKKDSEELKERKRIIQERISYALNELDD